MIKIKENVKRRSTKTKKPLVEYKAVTDINLKLVGSQFPPDFTETAAEVERNN